MAQSAVDLANNALERIGARSITSLGDASTEAVLMNARLDQLRQTFLRIHPWNFAVDRKNLNPTWYTITNVVNNGSGLYRVTTAGHPFSTDDSVTIEQVVGTEGVNQTWQVTKIDANTIDLQSSTFAGTYTSGGRVTTASAFDFPYKIALPSNWLRNLRVNESVHNDDWRIEGKFILALSYPLQIKYVKDVTDYTQMDVAFYDVFGAFVAWRLSFKLTQSESIRKQLFDEYRLAVGQARFIDATEDPAEEMTANDWVDSRTGLARYVRDPLT